MKTFKTHIDELYKDYPGKGWLMPEDRPKIKPKDIIWRSKVHHWDQTVRSDNTRFIIVKDKGKLLLNLRLIFPKLEPNKIKNKLNSNKFFYRHTFV